MFFVVSTRRVVSRNNNNDIEETIHDRTTNNEQQQHRHIPKKMGWLSRRQLPKEDVQRSSWHIKEEVVRPHATASIATSCDCVVTRTQIYNHAIMDIGHTIRLTPRKRPHRRPARLVVSDTNKEWQRRQFYVTLRWATKVWPKRQHIVKPNWQHFVTCSQHCYSYGHMQDHATSCWPSASTVGWRLFICEQLQVKTDWHVNDRTN